MLRKVNPLTYSRWEDDIISHRDYSFFHSSRWARVLFESYNYTPVYFCLFENDKLVASIPVMEIRSVLTGKRGVSLPFSDYCEPLFAKHAQLEELLSVVIRHGKFANWQTVEFRSSKMFSENVCYSSCYYRHTLKLNESLDSIYCSFRDSTRRNIRKSMSEGVVVNLSHSLEALEAFYRLHSLTRKRHGLPPQPSKFFRSIFEHIISKEAGHIALASYQNKVIAAAIFCHFGTKAVYKYGASDYAFQSLRANNLLMWEAIKWYSDNKYSDFCFGRTEPDNEGLRRFKNGWGTKEHIIKYYEYNLKSDLIKGRSSHVNDFRKFVFHNLPIPILKLIGTLMYKHIG